MQRENEALKEKLRRAKQQEEGYISETLDTDGSEE